MQMKKMFFGSIGINNWYINTKSCATLPRGLFVFSLKF